MQDTHFMSTYVYCSKQKKEADTDTVLPFPLLNICKLHIAGKISKQVKLAEEMQQMWQLTKIHAHLWITLIVVIILP
jgi:hypothetical protein